jgi:hypothetical protein
MTGEVMTMVIGRFEVGKNSIFGGVIFGDNLVLGEECCNDINF